MSKLLDDPKVAALVEKAVAKARNEERKNVKNAVKAVVDSIKADESLDKAAAKSQVVGAKKVLEEFNAVV